MSKTYYITTAIDYVNGQPHLGHAYEKMNQDPQTYCDALAQDWQRFAVKLNLTHDDFVRTTDPRHTAAVQELLSRLHASGHLYQAEYRGYYSPKEETFLTEKDRRPDGTFDPAFGEVIELVEEDYYFKLKEHPPWLGHSPSFRPRLRHLRLV